MRYSIIMAGIILLAASCSTNESENLVENPDGFAPVTVRVNDFSISLEDFPDTQGVLATTRAKTVGEYDGLKRLTLAFYKSDGTEMFKATHTKGSMPEGETFGEFSTTLPLGSYNMVVLGYVLYDDDALTLTSPTQAEYTVNAPRETFASTRVVNVSSTTALNLSATLDRIVAKLNVVSTDGITANVNKVRMSFSAGGKAFNPTTGLATVNTGSVSTVGTGASVGATSNSIGYVFLANEQQEMSVTIETLDSDGNPIFSKTVDNVLFKRNHITKFTGAMYDVNASTNAGGFLVNTDWDGTIYINF